MTARYRVGLLGHGIGPSLSPALHMREAAHLGLDYEYRVVDLAAEPEADLGAVLARLEGEGFAATNVTHPFKRSILTHVGRHSDIVKQVGSTNLVVLRDGSRMAHNTDGSGFRSALERFLGDRARGTVLQVGAGGAGLATASALLDMGFQRVVVHDRDDGSARALVERFAATAAGRIVASGPDAWLGRVDGVVHVTPTGMREHPGVAVDVDRLRPDAWVAEVVYRPLVTELVRRARARGLDVLDGGEMAVGQAVDSLRLVTGHDPDRTRMAAHFTQLVAGAELPEGP